jgi:hypothetical protein
MNNRLVVLMSNICVCDTCLLTTGSNYVSPYSFIIVCVNCNITLNPIVYSILSAIGTYVLLDYLQQRHDIATVVAGTIAPIVAPRAKIPGTGIIHSAMVDTSGNEQVTSAMITAFNSLAGKRLGAVYWTDHWFKTVSAFPLAQCSQIKAQGATPFIRMNADELKSTVVNCAAINSGKYDTQLKAYAAGARAFVSPICAEIGTEVNGKFLGFTAEGSAAYIKMVRKVVGIFRAGGATNVRWFFHGDFNDLSSKPSSWYPGDDVMDWVGSSFYGQSNGKGCMGSLATNYNGFAACSKTKPMCILEYGLGTVQDTQSTLAGIPTKYPRIKLLSYWHEKGSYDRRINKSPQNLAAYKQGIANPVYVSKYYDP